VASRSRAVRLLDDGGCVLLYGVDTQHRRDRPGPLLAHHAQRRLHPRAPATEAPSLSPDDRPLVGCGRRHLRRTAARLENRYASYSKERLSLIFPRHLFSRGSVATRLRCGGIFSDYFITRLLLSQTVKIFENRSTFGKVRVSCFYFDSQGIEMLGELLLVFLVL